MLRGWAKGPSALAEASFSFAFLTLIRREHAVGQLRAESVVGLGSSFLFGDGTA